MKIRNGFVTNSSSSSFVISFLKNENGDYIEETKQALINASLKMLTSSGKKITTIDELDAYYKDYCYVKDISELEDYDKEEYNNYKSLIKNDQEIIIGNVSDEDSIFTIYDEFFKNMKDVKGFTGHKTDMYY